MSFSKWAILVFLGSIISLARSAHVYYSLDLTWEIGAPNGVEREMVFVNQEFPGPVLVADQGDDITVDVINNLPFNTSVHFHGIEQKGTPWSDGVSGLTQWAIKPGSRFRYHWHANTYGTYWYHAHDKSTVMDGLYGAIRISPSSNQERPFSMISNSTADINAMKDAERDGQVMVLSDWTNFTSERYMEALEQTGYDIFCSDSVLVNGRGSIYCKDPDVLTSLMAPSARKVVNATLTDKGCVPFVEALQGPWEHHPEKLPPGLNSGCHPSKGSNSTFQVYPDARWASFHLISAASLKALVFSIDAHPMYVYEVDGHYIEPRLVHSLPIFNGERYSVMIKLDNEPGDYKIRVPNSGANQVISGFATLSYAAGENRPLHPQPYVDYGGQNTTADVIQLDTDNLPPYPPRTPSRVSDDLHILELGRINSSWEWTLDGTKFFPVNLDAMEPAMLNPQTPELASALKITTKNDTWVDIVYQLRIQPGLLLQPPHPMHKHSNKAFLIGRGRGTFQWNSVEEAVDASPQNFFQQPVYRDTFVTMPKGEAWMVIRYHVVNPGPFLLHCHTETHLFSGMGMLLLDGIDAWPEVPEEYVQGREQRDIFQTWNH